MDELETAMKNYGMGNEATIKDILSEVDTDNVSRSLRFPPSPSTVLAQQQLYINDS